MTSSSSNNCASFKPNRLWRVYSPYQRAPTALGTNGYLRPGFAHQLKRLQREFFRRSIRSATTSVLLTPSETPKSWSTCSIVRTRVASAPLKLSTGSVGVVPAFLRTQSAAQLVFERVNARADRRLADVMPVSGADELPLAITKKSLCQLCIYSSRHTNKIDINWRYFSFVKTNCGHTLMATLARRSMIGALACEAQQ